MLVNFTIYLMISIIFLGQIFGDASMTIATDWNSLLGELSSGGRDDALGCFGVVRYGIALQR
jgi:hypothetical protein